MIFHRTDSSPSKGGTRKKDPNHQSLKLMAARKIELYIGVECKVIWSGTSDQEVKCGWISGISSAYCKSIFLSGIPPFDDVDTQ